MTHEDIQKLRAPFPASVVHVKIQSLSKDRTKAMLVKYLQHTDVMNRLEEVDPSWGSSVLWRQERGALFYVAIAITIKGVSRENAGEGDDPKGAYSDALKRAAMLFGVGRYLYDEETQWVDYDERKDKYKKWSVSDFRTNPKPLPAAAKPIQSAAPSLPATEPSQAALRISEKQVWRLYAISNDKGFSQSEMRARLMNYFGHESAKDLTPGQYKQICDELLNLPAKPWRPKDEGRA